MSKAQLNLLNRLISKGFIPIELGRYLQAKGIRRSASGASSEISRFLRGDTNTISPLITNELAKFDKANKPKTKAKIKKARKKSVFIRNKDKPKKRKPKKAKKPKKPIKKRKRRTGGAPPRGLKTITQSMRNRFNRSTHVYVKFLCEAESPDPESIEIIEHQMYFEFGGKVNTPKPKLSLLREWVILNHNNIFEGHTILTILEMKAFRVKSLRDDDKDGFVDMKGYYKRKVNDPREE